MHRAALPPHAPRPSPRFSQTVPPKTVAGGKLACGHGGGGGSGSGDAAPAPSVTPGTAARRRSECDAGTVSAVCFIARRQSARGRRPLIHGSKESPSARSGQGGETNGRRFSQKARTASGDNGSGQGLRRSSGQAGGRGRGWRRRQPRVCDPAQNDGALQRHVARPGQRQPIPSAPLDEGSRARHQAVQTLAAAKTAAEQAKPIAGRAAPRRHPAPPAQIDALFSAAAHGRNARGRAWLFMNREAETDPTSAPGLTAPTRIVSPPGCSGA